MAKSSIHFEKTDASFAKKHNSRAEEPTYLLPKKFWQGNTFEEIYTSKNLDVMYRWQCRLRKRLHRRGSTPTLKNSLTEAVINLNSTHTLDDVKRVAQAIQEQYNFTPVSYAIHRDEGHMESRNGKTYPVYNYHAHVVFFTMADGESQRRKLGSKELEEINTLTAKLLGMERGESKTQRWQRVADLLGVEVEQLWREEGESATDYKERMRIFAAERGIEDFDIYKAVKPKKRLSAKQYREFAERMEKQKILTEKEVEERFKEALEKDQKTISKLTKDNTVLSNNNNAKAQTLIEIAKELEVPKNEKGGFTLNDIKEKVKALNQENKLCKKDISTICETVRKAFIGTGVPKEFYRELGAIKKSEIKEVHNLQQALMALLMKYEDTLNDKDKEISDLKDEKTVLSKQPPKEIETPVEVIKEVPRELTVDEIKQTQPYQELLTYKEALENQVKALGNVGQVSFAEKDDCFTFIDKVKAELSKTQNTHESVKPVEVVKTLSFEEIEQLPRVIKLKQEIETTHNYYAIKPNDFTFKVSADDIKPRKLDFLHVESKQGIADRINRQIKEQINPLIKKNRALEHHNAVLSKENKELKENNSILSQSIKELTSELKEIYSAFSIPFKKTIKERLNSIKVSTAS